MTNETVIADEVESIAAQETPDDFGRELRERIAGVLHCKADELHPDKGRRADA